MRQPARILSPSKERQQRWTTSQVPRCLSRYVTCKREQRLASGRALCVTREPLPQNLFFSACMPFAELLEAAAIIDLGSRCHEDCGPEFTPEHEKENDAASFLLSVRDQEEYAPARRRTQEPLGICDGGPVTPPLNNHRRRSKAESDLSDNPAQPAQWPTGAWAHASVLLDPNEQLPELFESFRTCRGVQSISQQFMKLLGASITHTGADLSSDTGQFSGSGMPLDVIRKAIGKQRRLAAMLWERLDARLHGADYLPKPLAGHKAVIVGSGPVGLRCALELRLLGAEV